MSLPTSINPKHFHFGVLNEGESSEDGAFANMKYKTFDSGTLGQRYIDDAVKVEADFDLYEFQDHASTKRKFKIKAKQKAQAKATAADRKGSKIIKECNYDSTSTAARRILANLSAIEAGDVETRATARSLFIRIKDPKGMRTENSILASLRWLLQNGHNKIPKRLWEKIEGLTDSIEKGCCDMQIP